MPKDLNWRKGFFRLWLAASCIWVIFCGIVMVYPSATSYIESLKIVQEMSHYSVPGKESSICTVKEIYEAAGIKVPESVVWPEYYTLTKLKERREHEIFISLGVAFLVPATALLLGMIAMWVFWGFAPKRNQRKEG
ncbi:MAG: hypothetical protein ABSC04_20675 [Syntrophobacteraceae bacterium]